MPHSALPLPHIFGPPPLLPAAAQKSDDAAFLKTTSKEVAAKLGITGAAPAFAIGRNYPDFGIESVPGAGHKAFEGALGKVGGGLLRRRRLG